MNMCMIEDWAKEIVAKDIANLGVGSAEKVYSCRTEMNGSAENDSTKIGVLKLAFATRISKNDSDYSDTVNFTRQIDNGCYIELIEKFDYERGRLANPKKEFSVETSDDYTKTTIDVCGAPAEVIRKLENIYDLVNQYGVEIATMLADSKSHKITIHYLEKVFLKDMVAPVKITAFEVKIE